MGSRARSMLASRSLEWCSLCVLVSLVSSLNLVTALQDKHKTTAGEVDDLQAKAKPTQLVIESNGVVDVTTKRHHQHSSIGVVEIGGASDLQYQSQTLLQSNSLALPLTKKTCSVPILSWGCKSDNLPNSRTGKKCEKVFNSRTYKCYDCNGAGIVITQDNLGPSEKLCFTPKPVPVDCTWKAWNSWNNCDVSCGGGSKERKREIDIVSAKGGKSCAGPGEQTKSCGEDACPTTTTTTTKTYAPITYYEDTSGAGSALAFLFVGSFFLWIFMPLIIVCCCCIGCGCLYYHTHKQQPQHRMDGNEHMGEDYDHMDPY